jgi:hypothetical protein
MTLPPAYDIRDLGHQAQTMAKNCGSEKLAMTLQYVALGSMIIMAGTAAAHLMKELFAHDEPHGRSR